jgi:hypothetical protein
MLQLASRGLSNSVAGPNVSELSEIGVVMKGCAMPSCNNKPAVDRRICQALEELAGHLLLWEVGRGLGCGCCTCADTAGAAM